jgi:hypothetical protein
MVCAEVISKFLSLFGEIEMGAERILENVAPVGIEAKSDVSGRELGHVEDSAVVGSLEENSDLAGVLVGHIVEKNDVERCSANTVAVAIPVDDLDGDAGSEMLGHRRFL